jgi:hypothetical protein
VKISDLPVAAGSVIAAIAVVGGFLYLMAAEISKPGPKSQPRPMA